MSQEFKNAKIYKITNDYNDEVYVGSTCNTLIKRFSHHKCSARKFNARALYKLMNEIGETRFRIELIEHYPCEDKYQLRQREGYFIREMGTLNMQIAGRTKQTYIEEHSEMYKNIKTKYRENNKDKTKEYYIKIKDKVKEKNMQVIACECGCNITLCNKQRHEKSKKHIKLMESLSITDT
jgi:group I intron endonuclease